jgi:hypothetical protein
VKIVLLGPQRHPALDAVVQSMDLDGRIATITAGWQEREPDDEELDDQLDGHGVNLSLHARWLDVQERDREYADAERRVRAVLDDVQQLYLLRLDHGLRAVYDVQRRREPGRLYGEALAEAIDAVRALDEQHLRRIGDVHTEFYDAWAPHDRAVIAAHRDAVARLLRDTAALVVAGGHVGVLVTAMHLFNVAASLAAPVIAWSAGAMALTDRIVLFHDRSVHGPGNPELYGRGLSLLRGVVPLPHASGRLLLDDADRMSVFARRFAPARCVLLEAGTRVDTDSDGCCLIGTRVLAEDGRVAVLKAA